MEYIVTSIVMFGLGWYCSDKYAIWQATKVLKNVQKKLELEKQKIAENTINLKMEKYNDVFMFYNKKTDAFFTSAKTKTELLDFIDKNYSDKYVYLDQSAMDILSNHEPI